MKVCIDSRTVQAGDVFIPVKGPHFDGHDFIEEAAQKGARILDVDLYSYAKKYRKKLPSAVIAVTGSAGKTTVKDMLYAVLSEKYQVVKTEENQNNEIGTPLTVLRADSGTEILIVELAMRNLGEIKYLSQLVRPTHVVITNVGLTHVEILKTAKKIAQAKGEIFLPVLSWEKVNRKAFLNLKSPFFDYLGEKAKSKGYQVIPYGGEGRPEQNINVCYALGREFGLSNEAIQKGISKYKPSAHRLQLIRFDHFTLIDDTYNANPDGVAYALQFLEKFDGRKILVLGDMGELGDRASEEHQSVVSRAIEANVSMIFTFGEISSQILSKDIPVYRYLDRDELNKHLVMEIKNNDVVLLKGSRSMKMEVSVQYVQRHFEGLNGES